MLLTKIIQQEEYLNITATDVLLTLNSKDPYRLRPLFLDLSFLPQNQQNIIYNNSEIKGAALSCLEQFVWLGDIHAIDFLVTNFQLTDFLKANPNIEPAIGAGILLLSRHGYFADVFRMISFFNFDRSLLRTPEFQASALLGLVAVTTHQVAHQPEPKVILDLYALGIVSERSWELAARGYFLERLSNPIIYKGYIPGQLTQQYLNDFIALSGLDSAMLLDTEVIQAAITGVIKLYEVDVIYWAEEIINVFNLWHYPELSYIVKQLLPHMLTEKLTFFSPLGIPLKISITPKGPPKLYVKFDNKKPI